MRFEGDIIICEGCGRVVSELDILGTNDYPLCTACNEKESQRYRNTICCFCGERIGNKHAFYNINDYEKLAHAECVNITVEREQENWSDEYDF